MYLNVCECDEFLSCHKWPKMKFGLFRPNLHELGLFHPYFACKCSFREVSMIKMVILDQSKTITPIIKIEKSKIRNL